MWLMDPGLRTGVLSFRNRPLVSVVGLRGAFLGDAPAGLDYP